MRTYLLTLLLAGCFLVINVSANPKVVITGDTTDRHTMTFTITGPEASETGDVNPFTDYRLTLRFQYVLSGAERYEIPGYFAADGKAGETGAKSGNIWKAHFTPQWPGAHIYKIFFRKGPNVALGTDTADGSPVEGIDGDTGSFDFKIEGTDTPPDLKAIGRLDVDKFKNYMVFVKNGFSAKKIFLKQGTSSPSNFLDYADFDNTPATTYTKSYATHVTDWKSGDPSWGNGGKGKGIIGAINYLASEGVNTISFNTLTIGGTDNSIFPYISPDSLKRFDCSKLDQWLTVFRHANSKGIIMELRTQSPASEKLLDNGDLGATRKLYYRELIARYAHCLGIIWNLGDENGQTMQQRSDIANYLQRTDPHQYPCRPIILPLSEGTQAQLLPSFLKENGPWITGFSLQTSLSSVHDETKKIIDSIKTYELNGISPRLRTVTVDFQTPKATGVPTDVSSSTPNQDDVRKNVLWGNLMAKGAGVSYYFGSTADLSCQDFRSYNKLWDYYRFAERFFRNYLLENALFPTNQLAELTFSDDKLSGVTKGYCLSLDGYQPFVIYLPSGGNASLDLSTSAATDSFQVWWYNPRTGGALQKGDVIVGGAVKSIGNPPADKDNDWACLIVPKELGSPDDGTAIRDAKSKRAAGYSTHAVRYITTNSGVIRLDLSSTGKHDLVQIIAPNGKIAARGKPDLYGIMEIRLQVPGIYLVCGNSKGSSQVIARILKL